MKRNTLIAFATLFCSALLFTACSKDENSSGAELTYKLEPTNLTASVGSGISESGLTVKINSNSSLTWNGGYVTISQLIFEAKKDNSEIEYKLPKKTTIDFFQENHEFGSVKIAPGTYDEVELKLVLKKQTTGSVFALSGEYTNELGQKTPVEFNYNEDLSINIEAEDLTVNTSTDYTGLLTLQLNKLLSGVSSSDFRSAVKDANGRVVISNASNVALFNKIKAGVAAFAKAEFKS